MSNKFRTYSFEQNPVVRQIIRKRLAASLKRKLEEFAVRTGEEAAVLLMNCRSPCSRLRILGTRPFICSLSDLRKSIVRNLRKTLAKNPSTTEEVSNAHDFHLPPLVFDDTPVPLERMNQSQLRSFIPTRIKCSSQRSTVGWRVEEAKPEWWPEDVPWRNIRTDTRSPEEKNEKSWSNALRDVIRNCYEHHGRTDLLLNETAKVEYPEAGFPQGTAIEVTSYYSLNGENEILLSTEDGLIYPLPIEKINESAVITPPFLGDEAKGGQQILQVVSLRDVEVVSKILQKVLEYAEDLKYYWVDGYGHELTYRQACPAFNDLIKTFRSEEALPKATVYFTHSGTLLKMLAHLQLYKDDRHLTVDGFQKNRDRKWRVSHIDPFGANLFFLLFDCGGQQKVLTLHHEEIVRLPSCPGGDLCDLKKILQYYSSSVESCSFDEMCENDL